METDVVLTVNVRSLILCINWKMCISWWMKWYRMATSLIPIEPISFDQSRWWNGKAPKRKACSVSPVQFADPKFGNAKLETNSSSFLDNVARLCPLTVYATSVDDSGVDSFVRWTVVLPLQIPHGYGRTQCVRATIHDGSKTNLLSIHCHQTSDTFIGQEVFVVFPIC